MERADRNQSQPSPTTCFKCDSIFASLSALEIHLRSCDVGWEPPRAAPWTFIPPPDSLGGSENGRGTGRGRGTGLGQTNRRGTSSDGRGRGASHDRDRGRGRGRGRGSDDKERGNNMNTNTTGRGRGRGTGSKPREANDNASNPSSPRGQRGGHRNARGRGRSQQQRGGRRSSTASNSSETSSPWPSNPDPESPNQDDGANMKQTGPTCSKCQLSFANSQELVKHFNDSPAHPNSGFSSPPSESSPRTSTLPSLSRHWPTSGPSPCTKCNIVFDSPQELSEHFRKSKDHPDSLPIVGYKYGVPVFAGAGLPDGWWEEYLRRREMETMMRERADDWFENLDEEEARLILELRQLGLW
ncbi:hypothetical protein V8F06_009025 [Rhypophila decipiens]